MGAVGLADGTRKIIYGKTRVDVQNSVVDILKKKHDGLPIRRNERQTLGKFVSSWLNDVAKPSTRPSTYRGYEQKLRVHVLSHPLAKLQLTQVSPQDVEAFLNEKLKAGQSAQSVQHLRAILRTALSTAVKWGFVPRNAAALADGPRVIHPEVQAPTPAEARTLLEAVRGDRLEALYTVALAIGLRQGEALGLRWKDVDLAGGTLSVRAALQRRIGGFDLVEPKTARSRRTIALPAVAVTALQHHHERQEFERKKLKDDPWGNDWDLVFTTADGKPLHGTEVTHLFQRLLRKAGLPHQRFHDLRHACASLLLAQGEHPRVVMETLGHSTIALTMNTYSHVMPQMQREAANKMDAVLSQGAPATSARLRGLGPGRRRSARGLSRAVHSGRQRLLLSTVVPENPGKSTVIVVKLWPISGRLEQQAYLLGSSLDRGHLARISKVSTGGGHI